MNMKKNYVNAQWQGGSDPVTRDGANEIAGFYLEGQEYAEMPVSSDETEAAVKKNGIIGFDILCRQMHAAYRKLQEEEPDTILTLGGGCDADVPAVVYLLEKYQGDLGILWLDAHGDLNTPRRVCIFPVLWNASAGPDGGEVLRTAREPVSPEAVPGRPYRRQGSGESGGALSPGIRNDRLFRAGNPFRQDNGGTDRGKPVIRAALCPS